MARALLASDAARVAVMQINPPWPYDLWVAGYVATDMSSWRGYKHASEGADTPSWLALLAPPGTSGKFFSSRKEESF